MSELPMTNHFKALAPSQSMPFLGTMLVQESECSYFEDQRPTTIVVCAPASVNASQFDQALKNGMRRSGALLYRPLCHNCRKCLPIRIPVDSFELTKSQERVLKRCDPLFKSTLAKSAATDEKIDLYQRYQASKHNEQLSVEGAREVYERFLVESCVETRELSWRTKEGKLVGVGILDITESGLSSVYFYWDPDFASFGLGTFSVLKEIELTKSLGLPYYYLGYYVPGSPSMDYKIHFGPSEIWNGSGFERLVSKDFRDPKTFDQINELEAKCVVADEKQFDLLKSYDFDSFASGTLK
jgi:arginyl-tRNA--protein-N-Asp/Glu arginylyltransferase